MAPSDRATVQFDLTKTQYVMGAIGGGRTKWVMGGPPGGPTGQSCQVCKPLWQHAHMISPGKLSEYCKLIQNGHLVLPAAAPRLVMASDEMIQADAWFLELYNEARPQAETIEAAQQHDLPTSDMDDMDLLDVSDHPLWQYSILIADSLNPTQCRRYVRKRFVDHQTFEDIFQKHVFDCKQQGITPVSRSTLERSYKSRW